MNFRLLPIVTALLAGSIAAQPALRTAPRRFVSQELQLWTAPFRPSNYTATRVKTYVLPAVLVSAALIATDRRTGELAPNTPAQVKWAGRVSQAGAWYSLGGVAGGLYLAGRNKGDLRAAEAGLLGLEALGHTQVAVLAWKQATNRARPVDGDGRGRFWSGGNSFPSGHAASAFAFATVVAQEYKERKTVAVVAYALATAVAAARVGARRHWVSDVAVGSGLGYLIGRVTYKRNHGAGRQIDNRFMVGTNVHSQ